MKLELERKNGQACRLKSRNQSGLKSKPKQDHDAPCLLHPQAPGDLLPSHCWAGAELCVAPRLASQGLPVVVTPSRLPLVPGQIVSAEVARQQLQLRHTVLSMERSISQSCPVSRLSRFSTIPMPDTCSKGPLLLILSQIWRRRTEHRVRGTTCLKHLSFLSPTTQTL